MACQIEIPSMAGPEQRDRHLHQVAEKIAAALSAEPADLVVLPELSSVPYTTDTFDRLDLFAEPLDGPSFQAFAPIAREHQVTIAYGMPRIGENAYHISQVVVGPDGALIGHFDKLHIAQFGASIEKHYFTAGDHLLTFELDGVRIAPIICYDIRIPELSRTLCIKHRTDLIIHCGAYFKDESFYSWHHFVVTRALENQVHFLSLNRAGEGYGASVYCPPWVDENRRETHFGEAEAFTRFEIDTERMDAARRSYPFLADRLEDYAGLPKRG
jgi:nitrilase